MKKDTQKIADIIKRKTASYIIPNIAQCFPSAISHVIRPLIMHEPIIISLKPNMLEPNNKSTISISNTEYNMQNPSNIQKRLSVSFISKL